MQETSWIKELKTGDNAVIHNYHSGDTLAVVTRVTPTGRITAANITFNQKGRVIGSDGVGIHLKQATPELVEKIKKENVVKNAVTLAAAIGEKKVDITFEQAEKLNFLMAETIKVVTLHSPVWVSLHFGSGDEGDCEALYCCPLCEEYLDIINKAIRKHPKTKLGAGGLLEYLVCDDEVMDFYLQNQIAYIQPSLKVVGGDLLCVTEIGCKGELPYSALQALEYALMQQFHYDWGQDAECIDIPLPGSALTYVNGIARFGRKEDIERETGEKVEPLKNPTVCIRLYHDDFRGFDIAADQ